MVQSIKPVTPGKSLKQPIHNITIVLPIHIHRDLMMALHYAKVAFLVRKSNYGMKQIDQLVRAGALGYEWRR